MKHHYCLGALLAVCLGGAVRATAQLPSLATPRVHGFEELSLHVEVDLPWLQGAQHQGKYSGLTLADLPAELVLELQTDVGLTRLDLLDARGLERMALECQPASALGLSEVALECKGSTLAEVLREFAPGVYQVRGTTADGSKVEGSVVLAAQFPGLFHVLAPLAGAPVPIDEVVIAWTPSRGASVYTLEIEQADSAMSFTTRLPPGQTSFHVPAQILERGQNYDISLTVRGDTDNEFELEAAFVTAH